MKKTTIKYCIFIQFLFLSISSSSQKFTSYKISSPEKSTYFEIATNKNGILQYRVFYAGGKITYWSKLGFIINKIVAGEKTKINKSVQRKHREKFAWPLGEDDTLSNNFNEISLYCQSSSIKYQVIARVFDGSVAFRYEIPEQPGVDSFMIRKENTEFNFLEPFLLYQYNQESSFTPVSIDTFEKTCDLPATITNSKLFISLGEAGNYNYTKTELIRGSQPHCLTIAFVRDKEVNFPGSFTTPWRTISISKTAIGLHQFSQLFIKLTQVSSISDLKWIKPGKLIRSQLNTQNGIDCIDFAEKNNFQYIMFDAGWYGAEFRSGSDPTQPIPEIDMPRIVAYGEEKNIGVILYVNYVGLKAKLDTILPLYKKWGIKGLKFGFVDGLTQSGLSWLSTAIKKVNDHGFILDIHDNYKPTGLSRTYPALLTQEGIKGDENSPDAFHTTVLPFTRFLAGPADFTFCYPNAKNNFSKNLKVSMAQQLALAVIYFSPLQAIFWYGNPNDYSNEVEIEFFKKVPTVWNESHYLAGDIGKNICVARRKGNVWFMGSAAGLFPWNQTFLLNFLRKDIKYTATIYEDDGKGSIRKRIVKVKKGDRFSITLEEKAGQAVIIEPGN